MNDFYAVQVGKCLVFNSFVESTYPSFVLTDSVGWERFAFKFTDVQQARELAGLLGGRVIRIR